MNDQFRHFSKIVANRWLLHALALCIGAVGFAVLIIRGNPKSAYFAFGFALLLVASVGLIPLSFCWLRCPRCGQRFFFDEERVGRITPRGKLYLLQGYFPEGLRTCAHCKLEINQDRRR